VPDLISTNRGFKLLAREILVIFKTAETILMDDDDGKGVVSKDNIVRYESTLYIPSSPIWHTVVLNPFTASLPTYPSSDAMEVNATVFPPPVVLVPVVVVDVEVDVVLVVVAPAVVDVVLVLVDVVVFVFEHA